MVRFARRTGVVIRSLWTPWPDGLVAQGEAFYQALEEIMRRRQKPGASTAQQPHADATELLERWPTLASWLTDPTFEDGESRQGGWMAVSADSGVFKALLKDQAEGLQINVSAATPRQLLDLVEHVLTDPNAPWRHDRGRGEPKPRRRK